MQSGIFEAFAHVLTERRSFIATLWYDVLECGRTVEINHILDFLKALRAPTLGGQCSRSRPRLDLLVKLSLTFPAMVNVSKEIKLPQRMYGVGITGAGMLMTSAVVLFQ